MQRFPGMKVVVAHGKASWMEEVLEKMEASARVIPLLHHYPVRTDTDELWHEGKVMLGFDAEERLIRKLPHDFAEKVVWGSRYPHHDTTSAEDAIATLRGSGVPGRADRADDGRQRGLAVSRGVGGAGARADIAARLTGGSQVSHAVRSVSNREWNRAYQFRFDAASIASPSV